MPTLAIFQLYRDANKIYSITQELSL